jgi:membrane associated rhomboid family serine protease
MDRLTDTVKHLIIINVLVFISANFIFKDIDLTSMFALYSFKSENFQWYQLITHMFTHASFPQISHIAFNMYALYSFGSALEHFWGGKRFLFFYITCGLGAAIINNLVNQYFFLDFDSSAVGASGAIYGLLVAFGFMFPEAGLGIIFIPIPVKAKYFIPGIIAIDLFLGLRGSSLFGAGGTGIAHFAHIGGALTGFIIMWLWRNSKFNHTRWN